MYQNCHHEVSQRDGTKCLSPSFEKNYEDVATQCLEKVTFMSTSCFIKNLT